MCVWCSFILHFNWYSDYHLKDTIYRHVMRFIILVDHENVGLDVFISKIGHILYEILTKCYISVMAAPNLHIYWFLGNAQGCQGDTLPNIDHGGLNVIKMIKYFMWTLLHASLIFAGLTPGLKSLCVCHQTKKIFNVQYSQQLTAAASIVVRHE